MIVSAYVGKSADVIPYIFSLHCSPPVLDVTYNKGAFWTGLITDLFGCDIQFKYAKHVQADYKQLPFRAGVFGTVVIDPPYGNLSTSLRRDNLSSQYSLRPFGSGSALLREYMQGMREMFRVLRPKGVAVVKCQDFVNSNRQHLMSVAVVRAANKIGFRIEDVFILVQKTSPLLRHPDRPQKHARKNHSYFYVFKKGK